jgi:hypothetical protein
MREEPKEIVIAGKDGGYVERLDLKAIYVPLNDGIRSRIFS